MKILIVEDELLIREVLKICLDEEKYELYESENGINAIEIAKQIMPEVILLDLNLPDINGLDICKFIRANEEKFNDPYIMVISASDDKETIIKSFKSGVDEYLKKPFTSDEVISKIRKVYNMRKGEILSQRKYNEILMETQESHSTHQEHQEIPRELTNKEYELSKFFRENRDILLTREIIMKTLWDKEYKAGDRTVDSFVKNIRRKDDLIRKRLRTVIGKGYRLEL